MMEVTQENGRDGGNEETEEWEGVGIGGEEEVLGRTIGRVFVLIYKRGRCKDGQEERRKKI